MPEPISTALSLCIGGYVALTAYRRHDTAISAEGRRSVAAANAVLSDSESSQALFGSKLRALTRLHEVALECSDEDWDGYGARSYEPLALRNAADFIRALPNDMPMPDFAVEPDGSISLDWTKSRYSAFTLSIGASNRIAYAWIEGSQTGRGVVAFDGVTVPARLIPELTSVIQYGFRLRAA